MHRASRVAHDGRRRVLVKFFSYSFVQPSLVVVGPTAGYAVDLFSNARVYAKP